MKDKKCAYCKQYFTPHPSRPLQNVCFPPKDCAWKYQEVLKLKKSRKETAEKKKSIMTHPEWLELYQKVFNTFIRMRDKNEPCISCDTIKPVEFAAGHFYPTTYQYLRFNEDNVHKQCNRHCNMMKRGNLHEYRPRLIKKIGIRRVEKLDNDKHREFRISIPEIQEKIKEYKLKIKELIKQNIAA